MRAKNNIVLFGVSSLGYTATCFVHIVAILMTVIMILHIRSKYTAVGALPLTDGQNVAPTHYEAHIGRKEIVMFFYMYAFIELLAFFLDSGVIPSAHVSYPVRPRDLSNKARLMLNVSPPPSVDRRSLYRARGGNVHLSADQRFRRVPVCRGRNALIVMGTRALHR